MYFIDMVKGKTVAVVVPCHNEEAPIARVIETMPDFVDHVVVVDDCSTDKTAAVVLSYGAQEISLQPTVKPLPRLILVRHKQNRGAGGAIVTGYRWCQDAALDVAAVMSGDGRMDPADLAAIVDPVADEAADYCKGDRLFTGEAWEKTPKVRYLGNGIISLLTKIASGYWPVADSQSLFTAISLPFLRAIKWEQAYPRYGCLIEYLVRLNMARARVKTVPVTPIYGLGEKGGVFRMAGILRISWLLWRLFWWRMWNKYVIRDFHPLVLFYLAGLFLSVSGLVMGGCMFLYRILAGPVAATSVLFSAFMLIIGLQFGLFAMWFDLEANRKLQV
jgi:glycosyltransferase involved in cell wall biosynthesis